MFKFIYYCLRAFSISLFLSLISRKSIVNNINPAAGLERPHPVSRGLFSSKLNARLCCN